MCSQAGSAQNIKKRLRMCSAGFVLAPTFWRQGLGGGIEFARANLGGLVAVVDGNLDPPCRDPVSFFVAPPHNAMLVSRHCPVHPYRPLPPQRRPSLTSLDQNLMDAMEGRIEIVTAGALEGSVGSSGSPRRLIDVTRVAAAAIPVGLWWLG